MQLTTLQTGMLLLILMLGTMTTRFLPFLLLRGKHSEHPYLLYLGRMLPYASIGLLVVYCLRNLKLSEPTIALPQIVAIGLIVLLQYWRSNVLLSIGVGTVFYMFLVQQF